MTARLSPQREAEIREHIATCTNWSLGNLAARDLAAELAAVRAELAEAERASHCQSVAAINGTRCALPVRHHGDHANEQRNHYWDDEFAAETEVAS